MKKLIVSLFSIAVLIGVQLVLQAQNRMGKQI